MRRQQPAILALSRCRACGRPVYGRGKVCKSRRCPEYSHTWAGDVRQKLFQNLGAYGGEVLLSAVTAPGADVLPWDEAACDHLGEHRHSGERGCRVQAVAAREWNETASDRWRRLHRRARQDTLRRCGRGRCSSWPVCGRSRSGECCTCIRSSAMARSGQSRCVPAVTDEHGLAVRLELSAVRRR
jgi:hypothetical protein